MKEEIRGIEANRRKAYEKNGKLNSDEIKYHESLLVIEKSVNKLTKIISNICEENIVLEKEAKELYANEIAKYSNITKIIEEYQVRITSELEIKHKLLLEENDNNKLHINILDPNLKKT